MVLLVEWTKEKTMKKAMVFGGGVSGNGAKKLLENIGYEVILVDDKIGVSSSEGIKLLPEIEIFIKSPGTPYSELVKDAKKMGIEVIDEVELAYRYMKDFGIKSKIIAITGTNGKTTTTTKIKELLDYAGFRVKYAGNIGTSFAELVLENKTLDYIVLELSSYQLENVKEFKADIAIVINLAPDHLDRYEKVEDYYDAKFNIANNQGKEDNFILNIGCAESVLRQNKINAELYKVSLNLLDEFQDAYVKSGKLFFRDEYILDASNLSLKGRHNLENTLFIVTVGKILGISADVMREFLYHTGSLEHRMEKFFDYGEVIFINDSKGTNVESTRFAIEAYDNPILICGGVDKKLDLAPLASIIKEKVKSVYLIGQIAPLIEKELLKIDYPSSSIYNCGKLEEVVKLLKKNLNKDLKEVVLLSPATASFDQFKNYEERGKIFKKLIVENFTEGE